MVKMDGQGTYENNLPMLIWQENKIIVSFNIIVISSNECTTTVS